MDTQTIIDTLIAQAKRSEPRKVQSLINELERRIASNLPIPAGATTISPDVARTVIAAIQPYARSK